MKLRRRNRYRKIPKHVLGPALFHAILSHYDLPWRGPFEPRTPAWGGVYIPMEPGFHPRAEELKEQGLFDYWSAVSQHKYPKGRQFSFHEAVGGYRESVARWSLQVVLHHLRDGVDPKHMPKGIIGQHVVELDFDGWNADYDEGIGVSFMHALSWLSHRITGRKTDIAAAAQFLDTRRNLQIGV